MHRYETLFVLLPGLPEAQVRETMDRTRRLIEGMGGRIEDIDDWGTRDLAYIIRNQSQGNYILAVYDAAPEVVVEFERTLKLADEVLRFISLRVPEGRAVRKPIRRPAQVEQEAPVAEEGMQ
ncbi:MAG TPA: 30S ribosomal protein S6 [Terriglobales bacterium]|nr:30S ribosomal protein S6 [Terriglobales bacterium]